jgi:RNA polymerase sigma-70 factor (ECF subfamily)
LAKSRDAEKPARVVAANCPAQSHRSAVVSDDAMAQRLVRAKRQIKAKNIPYQVPDEEVWPERLNSVLAVLYLIFNEGYSALSGTRHMRDDLCAEAIRLAFLLRTLVSGEAEIEGLLALILLHDSRLVARSDGDGGAITLEEQDRSAWDQGQISQGREILHRALARAAPGPYQIQAAISAVHADAARFADTDWHQITLLYGELFQFQPSDVVALNAAVALSYARSPAAGLVALGEIAGKDTLSAY